MEGPKEGEVISLKVNTPYGKVDVLFLVLLKCEAYYLLHSQERIVKGVLKGNEWALSESIDVLTLPIKETHVLQNSL